MKPSLLQEELHGKVFPISEECRPKRPKEELSHVYVVSRTVLKARQLRLRVFSNIYLYKPFPGLLCLRKSHQRACSTGLLLCHSKQGLLGGNSVPFPVAQRAVFNTVIALLCYQEGAVIGGRSHQTEQRTVSLVNVYFVFS